MKKFIFTALFVLLLSPIIFVSASSDASTLQPQLVQGGWEYSGLGVAYIYRNGHYVLYNGEPSTYQVGDQVIKGSYGASIMFYNVGSQGKDDIYSKATLKLTTKSLEVGDIVTKPSTFREDPRLGPRWTNYNEPAASMPPEEVETIEYIFSGGIDGTFSPVNPLEKTELKLVESGSNLNVGVSGERTISIDISKYRNAFYAIADSGTRFSGITGIVEIRLPGECARCWHAAKLDTVLPVGTHIRTEGDGACVLSFADLSTFVLKGESEIILESPPAKDSKVDLIKGSVWSNVKKMFKEGSMEIEMNQAVCGTRGTTFVVTDDGQTSTLKVIEGVLNFKSKTTGDSKDVSAGQTISSDAKGLTEPTNFDVAKETAEWDNVKQKIEKGAGGGASLPLSGDSIFKFWYLLPLIAIAIGIILLLILKKKKKS